MKLCEWVNDCSGITRRLSGSPEQHPCLCRGLTATEGATNKQHEMKTRNLSRAQPAHDTELSGHSGRRRELCLRGFGVEEAAGEPPEPPPQDRHSRPTWTRSGATCSPRPRRRPGDLRRSPPILKALQRGKRRRPGRQEPREAGPKGARGPKGPKGARDPRPPPAARTHRLRLRLRQARHGRRLSREPPPRRAGGGGSARVSRDSRGGAGRARDAVARERPGAP